MRMIKIVLITSIEKSSLSQMFYVDYQFIKFPYNVCENERKSLNLLCKNFYQYNLVIK